jgi:putative SOS response-associated peptidase YedK
MGLIPYRVKDAKGGRKSLNAKGRDSCFPPIVRDAFARRRCLLPIDNFFEWRAIKRPRSSSPTPPA